MNNALKLKPQPSLYSYDRTNKLPAGYDSIFEPLFYHPKNDKKNAFFYIKADEAIFPYTDKKTNTIKLAKQTRHNINDLETVLSQYKGMSGITATANRFNGRSRKGEDLICSIMFYCDADIYKIESKKHLTKEQVIAEILDHCEANNIPYPNIINYSGGGYYLKWLFLTECTKYQLSGTAYMRVEEAINRLFADFGADNGAKDITRILRLPGTLNPKVDRTDRLCETIFYNDDVRYTMDELRYAFDKFQEPEKIKIPKPKKQTLEIVAPKPKPEGVYKKRDPSKRPKVTKSNMQLAKDRFDDLKTLIQLRNGNVQHSRMLFLFWLLNFKALCGATNFVDFEQDALKIASSLNFDISEWSLDDLCTLERKVIRHNRGYSTIKKQNGEHFKFSNLYTPKNETLINTFAITGDEQAHLKTIISPDEKQRRRAQKRLDMGMKPQSGEATSQPWIALGISRRTYYSRKKARGL